MKMLTVVDLADGLLNATGESVMGFPWGDVRVWAMRTGIVVEVTAAERARLEAIVADLNSPQKHVCALGSCWQLPTASAQWQSCVTPPRAPLS